MENSWLRIQPFLFIFLVVSTTGNSLTIRDKLTDTADFTLVKASGGIALYERWYSLTPHSRAREIKAIFTVRAKPGDAVSLMRDESKGTFWNKTTSVYKVVEKQDSRWISYIQYNLPWPVSNQDCVLQYNQYFSSDTLKVIFKGIDHPSFPIQGRTQRIQEISGKWLFAKAENGIHVEYYVTTTPNKNLPGWLTDPIIRNNLLETMVAFRDILERDR